MLMHRQLQAAHGFGLFILLTRAGLAPEPGLDALPQMRCRHCVNLSQAACASRSLRLQIQQLLNKGYLGSRNNEGRGEMRYPV